MHSLGVQDLGDTAQSLGPGIHFSKEVAFKDVIKSGSLRRMSKGVKMGMYAGLKALESSNLDEVDAIVTGTGMGCLLDSDQFLTQITSGSESFVTPTSFIQSTHNTVASQLALYTQNHGTNLTYVNGSNSFEMALLDALCMLKSGEESSVLVGGVDEISPMRMKDLERIGLVNTATGSSGTPYGEGAHFLVLSQEEHAENLAELVSVTLFSQATNFNFEIDSFLKREGMSLEEVSAVVIGINADAVDAVHYASFIQYTSKLPQMHYKHLSGQYDCSSGYGLQCALDALKSQEIPAVLSFNQLKSANLSSILLYNQYMGGYHSLVLIKTC